MQSDTLSASGQSKAELSEAPNRLPPQTQLPAVVAVRKPGLLQSLWVHRWFFLVLALAVGAGFALILRTLLGPSIVVDQIHRGSLVETVVASGHVETPYRAEIGSQITGTVQDVPVEEGEHVHRGQPLITIESSEL
jgi:HlyD family secretion protein